jgi:hypothetical protein
MAFWIMAPVSLASEVQYEFLFLETFFGQKSSDFLAYSNSNTRDLAYFFSWIHFIQVQDFEDKTSSFFRIHEVF